MKEQPAEVCSRCGMEILYAFGSPSGEIRDWLEGQIQRLEPSGSDADLEAKPYQIRQFLRIVEKYGLRLEDEK